MERGESNDREPASGRDPAGPDRGDGGPAGRSTQQVVLEQAMGRQNVRLRTEHRPSHARRRGPLLAAVAVASVLVLLLALWIVLA